LSVVFDEMYDARGLNCPMPLVNARKEIGKIELGQVLKVVATDRGAVADFQGWAKVAKNIELVAQETETLDSANAFTHYVRRTA
jgi:tRNA 2-thiouridine synthesizing protein A